MRVGIVGSDDYPEYNPFIGLLQQMKQADSELLVIVTDGEGFAYNVLRKCEQLGIKTVVVYADKAQYGKGATFKRNYHLAHAVDVLHAYWHNKSFGCNHIIGQAKAAGKRVVIHRFNEPDEIFEAKMSFKETHLEPKKEPKKTGRKVGVDEFGDDIYQQ